MCGKFTRNFSIIAHIDHGKSTLADRLIEACSSQRKMQDQMLDSMDIERERGITIKSQSVRLKYGKYLLNLVDTPGHVDFSYEVSRGLAACEGSILVVDSTQGVEAQTIANAEKALALNHDIVTVLNKVDLPASDLEGTRREIEETLGIEATNSFSVSAKTGEGVPELMQGMVNVIRPPMENQDKPLRALLMDSWYDSYLGVVVLVRIVDGCLKKGDKFSFLSTGKDYLVDNLGWFNPELEMGNVLNAGEIGFVTASIKNLQDAKVGDTIVRFNKSEDVEPLPGFKPSVPVVFCGFFPVDKNQYEDLQTAFNKLSLNDSSFTFDVEKSGALGFGFRCGFLGLLHMDIVRERVEREFKIDLVITAPSVVHKIHSKKQVQDIYNPGDMPDPNQIDFIEEPWIEAKIVVPETYVGQVITLCQEKRGVQKSMSYLSRSVVLEYEMPMSEVVFDFYDRLKSSTQGFATFDYQFIGYQEGDLVKVDILVNGEIVDALAMISHKQFSVKRGRKLCEKLKELIPRQQFKIALQAAIGSNIIARETIGAFRKDVTAKCYGGDVTRKRKLLEKQKAGKKRLRRVGKVDVPQEAFLAAVRFDSG